jgi:tetratricopeptide (TPR) repeat protein
MTKKEKADMFCGFGAYNNEIGNYEVAIDQFEKALIENPDMDIAWNNLGNAKRALRQNEEALLCYQKAIECSPNRFEFYYHKGLLLIELSKFKEAKQVLSEAVKLEKGNIDIHFQLAAVYKVLRLHNDAIESYKRCLELSPENPDILKNYIACLFSSGNKLEAENLINKYSKAHQGDLSWFLIIPHELISQNKADEIDPYFEKLKHQNHSLNFDWLKGFFFQNLGQLDLAESIYREVLNKEPNSIGTIYNLAQLLFQKQEYVESLNLINDCLLKDGNKRIYFDLKLVILQKAKTKEEVLNHVIEMEKIFTSDPLNIWFRYGLFLKSDTKEYEEAIKIFEKVNSIQENGWSHYQIGLTYNLLGQIENCLIHLQKAFSLDRSTREDARFFHELDVIRDRKDFNRILTNFEKEE